MNTDSKEKPKNRFERNPKKSIFILLLVFLFLLSYAAEKIVGWSSEDSLIKPKTVRSIRLKEHEPSQEIVIAFSDNYLPHTDGSAVKIKHRLKMDDQGFIFPSKKHDDPDYSVVFLGGSTTECINMDELARWPYLVGSFIEEKLAKKVNSHNGGVSGNVSLHSLNILINKVLPMNPQVVVMMHNINDLSVLMHEQTYWNKNPYRSLIIESERSNLTKDFIKLIKGTINHHYPHLYSRLYQLKEDLLNKYGSSEKDMGAFLGVDEFAQARDQGLLIDQKKLIERFESSLQIFISVCIARGITPVLMTQANRFTDNPDELIIKPIQLVLKDKLDYKGYKKLYDSFNETIRKVGQKNNILVIDLDRYVPKDKKYIDDTVHYNEFGSNFVAREISRQLMGTMRSS
jgi:hypothetical protein